MACRHTRNLSLIDLPTGKRTVLLTDPDLDYASPAFSPDGLHLACLCASHFTREEPHDETLVLVDTDGSGEARDLTGGLDRWPGSPVWDPAGRWVYFTADDTGRHPVFRVAVGTGEISRLTTDHGHYSELNPSPDGTALFALRSAVDAPPAPVRIDVATGEVAALDSPGGHLALPGRLTELETTADDGQPLRAWLVLPDGASQDHKAPLLLWVHGGPMSSWNSWSWRWNPWLMAARGYAVLLPDPALSTGYGRAFVARGYHQWGSRTFDDVMALTDVAVARDDIDGSRTAMMGGSYGGYMANWIAGHTDRFNAIVSHAGLWALDQMMSTTDVAHWFSPAVRRPADRAGNVRAELPAPARGEDHHPDPGDPRQQGLPGPGSGGAPAVVGPQAASARRQVPLLPRREPLDPHPRQRRGLVRDGVRVPRPARASRTLAAARAAVGGRLSAMTRADLDKQPAEVAAMFDALAGRYDMMNDILSMGQVRLWRKRVQRVLQAGPGERVLDLAAGTGTSSMTFAASGANCVACDFSFGMLQAGQARHGRGPARDKTSGRVAFAAGDALRLPFATVRSTR